MWYLHNQFMHGSHTCFWNPLFDDMDGTFANEAVTTLCCFSHQSNCSCKVICRESEQDHLSTHSVVVKSISYAAVMHWDTCTLLSNASRRLDSFPLFSEKTVLVNIDLGQCREIHLTIKYVKFRVVCVSKGFSGSVETGINGRELMMAQLASAKSSCVITVSATWRQEYDGIPQSPPMCVECGGLKIHVVPWL